MARYLVTGAGGFIGSSLATHLVNQGETVRAVDNLSTGKRENLRRWPEGAVEFHEGDIRDAALCERLCADVDYILHHAAMVSVPVSMADPLGCHAHNVTGTANLLFAGRAAGVKRLVLASSSAVYGETDIVPCDEDVPPAPLSPYALSKYVGEEYCRMFLCAYGLETVCLRYFNVFGPYQDPNGAYAAVIPKFIERLLRGERPTIFGDGGQTRDFVFVEDVVAANMAACQASAAACGGSYNIGGGERISLLEMFQLLRSALGIEAEPRFEGPRSGDVRHRQADISRARRFLGYEPSVSVAQGLERSIAWYRQALSASAERGVAG